MTESFNRREFLNILCRGVVTLGLGGCASATKNPEAIPTSVPQPTSFPEPINTIIPPIEVRPTLDPTTEPTVEPTAVVEPTVAPTVVPTVAPTAEPQPTTEAQPTRGPGALYEKDFPHLRKEGGEWRFGEIARIEETEDQRLFSLAGVILSEPEKRQVNALDSNGNIIYKYENWFVKIGYPDPQEEGGKLVTGEMEVWFEGVTQAAPVVFAKDGFIESRLPGGTGYDVIVRDRDEFLANFKYGEPVIVAILFDSPNGTMKRLLSKYAPGESFPGVTSIGKNIYFLSLLFDDENGIGKLDLPPLPTTEELKAWQEGRQLPRTNFLGCLNRVIVSGK